MPSSQSDGVEFLNIDRGDDVIVRGKRVPMLEVRTRPGGKVHLLFDRRIGLQLDAGNYEQVIDFVATVMENVMNPDCGRTFNTIHEVGEATSRSSTPDSPFGI